MSLVAQRHRIHVGASVFINDNTLTGEGCTLMHEDLSSLTSREEFELHFLFGGSGVRTAEEGAR